MKILVFQVMAFSLLIAEEALAAQAHVDPEGIYAHQISHLFFMFSMVMLIYWLRQRKLVRHPGWRYIQYAAFFFILWNVNVMLVHFLDEQSVLITVERISNRHIIVSSSLGRWAETTYYLARLDHLICVPALLFLFLGLKKLVAGTEKSPGGRLR